MSEEGEFKKRIRILKQNLVNPDRTMKYSSYIADAQEIADLDQFKRWLDEAKQEFPMTIEHIFLNLEGKVSGFKIKDVRINENSDITVKNLIDAFGIWFVKWLI